MILILDLHTGKTDTNERYHKGDEVSVAAVYSRAVGQHLFLDARRVRAAAIVVSTELELVLGPAHVPGPAGQGVGLWSLPQRLSYDVSPACETPRS